MEKTRRICPRAALSLLLALSVLAAPALAEGTRELVPVGRTVGIEASTDGLLVVSLSEVETAEGKVSPAAEGGIQPGDMIVRLGNCEVSTSEDFAKAAACLDGSPVAVQLMRGGELIQYTVTPALSAEDGCWRLGLWLRDGIAGIGTVTFYDPETGLFGALALPLGFASLAMLRDLSAAVVLAPFVGAFMSDTGAFFAGRAFGKRKLAPAVSPNKSWEGFAGSMVFGMITGLLVVHFLIHGPWWLGLVMGAALVVCATMGDLVESQFKRELGIKDMSNLLPGHGGLMDRLDGMLPAACATYALLNAAVLLNPF